MSITNSRVDKSNMQIFWGEISPCDHIVQIYEDDNSFIDLLNGFVKDGIESGDCVIVIATSEHLQSLENKLLKNGYNTFDLKLKEQFIPLDAEATLEKFVINGWPDEVLFNHLISDLIIQARRKNRQVRAFGEMVALLWAQGHSGATVQLEHMWSKICDTESLCLFCAYPRSGFTQDANESIATICGTHSKMITGFNTSNSEVAYKQVS